MKRIKKIKRRVAALAISFFLTLGLITPAFSITVKAEALEVANAACSLADIMMSYFASSGVAVLNTEYISNLYHTYGSTFGTLQTFVNDGLLTYSDGTFVDTGLSSTIEQGIFNFNELNPVDLFSQTASENPSGVALAGSGTLAGIAGSVATTGVLPLVAGVALEGYAGFQLGTLLAHQLGLYGDYIEVGLPVDSPNIDLLIANKLGGPVCAYIQNLFGEKTYMYYMLDKNIIPIGYKINNNTVYIGIANISDGVGYRKKIEGQKVGTLKTLDRNNIETVVTNASTSSSGTFYASNWKNIKNNEAEMNSYLTALRNGTEDYSYKTYSPDIISSNGNISYNDDNGNAINPNIVPQIDPSTESVDPAAITKNDWLHFANDAIVNLENGNPDLNSDVLQDILDAIRINTPTPAPNPEPEPEPNPDPNPSPDPETVPVPSINPYPDSYPVADPETVPDNKPQPEYTEKQTENQTDIIEGDPYTTPDLLNKFPFCIPRDILKVFKKLDTGSRQAPHIQWRFNPNSMIDYTFDIDFSTWDSVAALLRILELLAFIIALGIATRNLILS